MSNFELIDDYLTNRLSEQDKKSFEQHMNSDPALKADVELQKEIIQGLKSARVAELKAMLNKVPVASPAFHVSPMRIAAGLIGTAVVAAGLYFYFDKNDSVNPDQQSTLQVESIKPAEKTNPEITADNGVDEIINPIDKKDKKGVDTESKNEKNQIETTKEDRKPAIDLLDPTDELTVNQTNIVAEKPAVTNSSSISIAKIEVAVNSSEKKFKSHYQFTDGNLILYGDFDNDLYEIIEVNTQTARSLFLYYKSYYYLLDEKKKEVTALKEITDPVLIQKLKAFRAN